MKKILKILLLAVLSVACVMSAIACAPTSSEDSDKGLIVNLKKGVYIVTKYVAEEDDGNVLDLSLRDELKEISKIENVKIRIKTNAFSGNENIEELIIPSFVTEIDEGAFAGMKNLKKITLPFIGATANSDASTGDSSEGTDKATDNARTFAYVFGKSEYGEGSKVTVNYNDKTEDRYMPRNLRTVVIAPEADYNIPMDAFNGCVNLTTIVLNDKVKEIGEKAFNGCINLLYSLNVKGEDIEVIDFELPSSVEVIRKGAFTNCTKLLGSVLNKTINLKTIGESAFEGAFNGSEAIEIKLPANIVIGKKAFSASAVKTVELTIGDKDSIVIGDSAFASCLKLTKVVFGSFTANAEITRTIGQFAFKGAENLTQFGDTADTIKTDGFTLDSLAFDPAE
jgi:hypothetical protein